MPYTVEEKCDILSLFYKNNNNASAARAEHRQIFPLRAVPARSTFKTIERGFRERKDLKRKKRTVNGNEEEELNILLYFVGR